MIDIFGIVYVCNKNKKIKQILFYFILNKSIVINDYDEKLFKNKYIYIYLLNPIPFIYFFH